MRSAPAGRQGDRAEGPTWTADNRPDAGSVQEVHVVGRVLVPEGGDVARIGITGHSNLTADSVPLVRRALDEALKPYADNRLVGISCLARGADQLFAEAVLDAGGTLEVVLPSVDYRENKVKPSNRDQFDALLLRSSLVRYMPHRTAGSAAYADANEAVLSGIDRLFAVWDGRPAGGRGGTGDAVEAARGRGVPVEVIWPAGAEREQ